jgi:SHS2 domain-containing protein
MKKKKIELTGFEFLDHPADVQVHAWGQTLLQAYEQCANALMKTMTDPSRITSKITHDFVMEDDEKGSLLVAFLSEFLFLFDTNGLIFRTIHISDLSQDAKKKWHLKASAEGEKFDFDKHTQGQEVKAITYSYLEIDEKTDRVDIKIVYDI